MGSSSSSRHSEDWSAYQVWRGPRDGTWRTAEDELMLLLRLRGVQQRAAGRQTPTPDAPSATPTSTGSAAATDASPTPAALWYVEALSGLALGVTGFGLMVIGGASALASGAWVAWFMAICGFSVAVSGALFVWQRRGLRTPRAPHVPGEAAQPDARRPRRTSRSRV